VDRAICFYTTYMYHECNGSRQYLNLALSSSAFSKGMSTFCHDMVSDTGLDGDVEGG
jgi:hypothetical protein